MSGLPTSEPDFHFWDFVGCALCHLLFVPNDKGPPPVPFWLTECGHVVCNNHLSHPDKSFKTNSSPRSFTTPVGPLRLTLLPRGPQSLSRQDHGSSVQQTARPVAQRPGSTRFTEYAPPHLRDTERLTYVSWRAFRQYAYQHEENSQTHIPQASYDLSAPRPDIRPSAVGPDNLMPPPPKPQGGRFKPATPLVSDPNSQGTNALKRTRQHSPGLPDGMRPPPTPQRPFARVSQTPTHRGIDPFLSSNRFLSASTTDTVASQRSKDGSNLAGRQRMAFVPGNDTNLR
ncbi:hypothetical protein ID866_3502 [Astraeus odoratus]|nr:hypothetical protein ID866_3502 [Astraeus odoratus]